MAARIMEFQSKARRISASAPCRHGSDHPQAQRGPFAGGHDIKEGPGKLREPPFHPPLSGPGSIRWTPHLSPARPRFDWARAKQQVKHRSRSRSQLVIQITHRKVQSIFSLLSSEIPLSRHSITSHHLLSVSPIPIPQSPIPSYNAQPSRPNIIIQYPSHLRITPPQHRAPRLSSTITFINHNGCL